MASTLPYSKILLIIAVLKLLLLKNIFARLDFMFEPRSSDSMGISQGVYKNGTLILGGLFPIHFESKNGASNNSLECSGRFNSRGFEEAKAMMFAIENINNNGGLLPGVALGADIKETCNSVDFAVRNSLNFSFITRNIQGNMCTSKNTNAQKLPQTVAIVGPGISDVAMAVTSLVGLFHIPVVDYSSTSRLLNNRIRFKYFFRTVSSDALLSQAVVDFIIKFRWNIIHVLYSDTDYGRSAVETFENVLARKDTKICKATKGSFNIYSSKKHLKNTVNAIKSHSKAKVVVFFTTIQDFELILDQFMAENMKDFIFISNDYYSGSIRQFNCAPEMLRRVIGIVPHQVNEISVGNFVSKFDAVVNDTFCKSKWQAEYDDEIRKNTLTEKTGHSLYVPYVVDAVYAIAHALHAILDCDANECKIKPEDFQQLNRNGELLIKNLHSIRFKGLTRDPVTFDQYGNSAGAYDVNIVNPLTDEWVPFGKWTSNGTDSTDAGNSSHLYINIEALKGVWDVLYNNTGIPTSVCGKPCYPGYRMLVEKDYQVCCWKCVPCTRNYVSHSPVNNSCRQCPKHFWPNDNHTVCVPIVPTSVSFRDPPGIVVAIVAPLGSVIVICVSVVFSCFHGTHLVRSSSRLLSNIMLLGILLGYVTSSLLFVEKTEFLCQTVLYLFSVSFSTVVGTLLTKTNRIHRIFSKKAMRNGTPPCLSDHWMVLFISIIVGIDILICTIIIITTTGNLRETVYSELSNEAYLQCKFYATYADHNMAIWWSYNTGIVLVCTYQAYLTRKVPGSYNEARFIAFTMMTISTDVIVFFLSYYGTHGYYKDVFVSMFLIIAVSVALCCVFVPKVYVILMKPEKNADLRHVRSIGYIAGSDSEMRKVSRASQRSCTSYISNSSNASNHNAMQDGQANFNGNQRQESTKTRKMSVFVKNGLLFESREEMTGLESGQASLETMINSDEPADIEGDQEKFSRLWPGMSTRNVRFEDEVNGVPSVIVEEFDPSYLDGFEYKRRKSTI